eukprot:TRINITY_DN5804_c0_g1_i6.p1 TRINITY_DN5804_c0_g1~~TRINITY_DN5804_c0_g1_i6.p1  ORF type:complete len:2790 (-),score=560.91 TRINITY_DN5804_c0_g1_i6:193-8355(-)
MGQGVAFKSAVQGAASLLTKLPPGLAVPAGSLRQVHRPDMAGAAVSSEDEEDDEGQEVAELQRFAAHVLATERPRAASAALASGSCQSPRLAAQGAAVAHEAAAVAQARGLGGPGLGQQLVSQQRHAQLKTTSALSSLPRAQRPPHLRHLHQHRHQATSAPVQSASMPAQVDGQPLHKAFEDLQCASEAAQQRLASSLRPLPGMSGLPAGVGTEQQTSSSSPERLPALCGKSQGGNPAQVAAEDARPLPVFGSRITPEQAWAAAERRAASLTASERSTLADGLRAQAAALRAPTTEATNTKAPTTDDSTSMNSKIASSSESRVHVPPESGPAAEAMAKTNEQVTPEVRADPVGRTTAGTASRGSSAHGPPVRQQCSPSLPEEGPYLIRGGSSRRGRSSGTSPGIDLPRETGKVQGTSNASSFLNMLPLLHANTVAVERGRQQHVFSINDFLPWSGGAGGTNSAGRAPSSGAPSQSAPGELGPGPGEDVRSRGSSMPSGSGGATPSCGWPCGNPGPSRNSAEHFNSGPCGNGRPHGSLDLSVSDGPCRHGAPGSAMLCGSSWPSGSGPSDGIPPLSGSELSDSSGAFAFANGGLSDNRADSMKGEPSGIGPYSNFDEYFGSCKLTGKSEPLGFGSFSVNGGPAAFGGASGLDGLPAKGGPSHSTESHCLGGSHGNREPSGSGEHSSNGDPAGHGAPAGSDAASGSGDQYVKGEQTDSRGPSGGGGPPATSGPIATGSSGIGELIDGSRHPVSSWQRSGSGSPLGIAGPSSSIEPFDSGKFSDIVGSSGFSVPHGNGEHRAAGDTDARGGQSGQPITIEPNSSADGSWSSQVASTPTDAAVASPAGSGSRCHDHPASAGSTAELSEVGAGICSNNGKSGRSDDLEEAAALSAVPPPTACAEGGDYDTCAPASGIDTRSSRHAALRASAAACTDGGTSVPELDGSLGGSLESQVTIADCGTSGASLGLVPGIGVAKRKVAGNVLSARECSPAAHARNPSSEDIAEPSAPANARAGPSAAPGIDARPAASVPGGSAEALHDRSEHHEIEEFVVGRELEGVSQLDWNRAVSPRLVKRHVQFAERRESVEFEVYRGVPIDVAEGAASRIEDTGVEVGPETALRGSQRGTRGQSGSEPGDCEGGEGARIPPVFGLTGEGDDDPGKILAPFIGPIPKDQYAWLQEAADMSDQSPGGGSTDSRSSGHGNIEDVGNVEDVGGPAPRDGVRRQDVEIVRGGVSRNRVGEVDDATGGEAVVHGSCRHDTEEKRDSASTRIVGCADKYEHASTVASTRQAEDLRRSNRNVDFEDDSHSLVSDSSLMDIGSGVPSAAIVTAAVARGSSEDAAASNCFSTELEDDSAIRGGDGHQPAAADVSLGSQSLTESECYSPSLSTSTLSPVQPAGTASAGSEPSRTKAFTFAADSDAAADFADAYTTLESVDAAEPGGGTAAGVDAKAGVEPALRGRTAQRGATVDSRETADSAYRSKSGNTGGRDAATVLNDRDRERSKAAVASGLDRPAIQTAIAGAAVEANVAVTPGSVAVSKSPQQQGSSGLEAQRVLFVSPDSASNHRGLGAGAGAEPARWSTGHPRAIVDVGDVGGTGEFVEILGAATSASPQQEESTPETQRSLFMSPKSGSSHPGTGAGAAAESSRISAGHPGVRVGNDDVAVAGEFVEALGAAASTSPQQGGSMPEAQRGFVMSPDAASNSTGQQTVGAAERVFASGTGGLVSGAGRSGHPGVSAEVGDSTVARGSVGSVRPAASASPQQEGRRPEAQLPLSMSLDPSSNRSSFAAHGDDEAATEGGADRKFADVSRGSVGSVQPASSTSPQQEGSVPSAHRAFFMATDSVSKLRGAGASKPIEGEKGVSHAFDKFACVTSRPGTGVDICDVAVAKGSVDSEGPAATTSQQVGSTLAAQRGLFMSPCDSGSDFQSCASSEISDSGEEAPRKISAAAGAGTIQGQTQRRYSATSDDFQDTLPSPPLSPPPQLSARLGELPDSPWFNVTSPSRGSMQPRNTPVVGAQSLADCSGKGPFGVAELTPLGDGGGQASASLPQFGNLPVSGNHTAETLLPASGSAEAKLPAASNLNEVAGLPSLPIEIRRLEAASKKGTDGVDSALAIPGGLLASMVPNFTGVPPKSGQVPVLVPAGMLGGLSNETSPVPKVPAPKPPSPSPKADPTSPKSRPESPSRQKAKSPADSTSPASPAKGKGKSPKKGNAPPPPSGKGPGKGAPPPPGSKAKAQEPRKPDVKPGVQVKKLFWTSFRIDGGKNTVWNAIEQEGADIDTAELETLFCDEPPGSRPRNPSPLPENKLAVKKIQVLENQRRRQICVMLARLPSLPELTVALHSMDSEVLSGEQVELLLINIPSNEEIELLRRAEREHTIDEMNVWDTAEEFLFALLAVPQFQLRLQAWHFGNTFQERFDTVAEAVRAVSSGCECVLTSPCIRHLLGIVLYVGNYLNGGTPRGRADGFALDTLVQMRTVKMSQGDKPGTLVDYVTQQMERVYAGDLAKVFSSKGECYIMKRAARHKVTDLSEELASFQASAGQLVRKLTSPDVSDDPVLVGHADVLAARVAELGGLQGELKGLEARYEEIGVWFHMEDKNSKKPTDEFFGIWDKFLADVCAARKSIQEQRMKEKRRNSMPPRRSTAVSQQRERGKDRSQEVTQRSLTPHRTALGQSKEGKSSPHRSESEGKCFRRKRHSTAFEFLQQQSDSPAEGDAKDADGQSAE